MRVQLEPVFRRHDRWSYALYTVLWIAANVVFWTWWLRPDRIADPLLYALFTSAWAYEVTVLPSMYLFFVGRMRRPRHMPPPHDLRVALITLCVPSQESLAVIEQQLSALAAVTYPHDSWVLDEGNHPAVRAAAERLGVRYFSRRGLDRYNQPHPPFKARTKAGNVNAWLHAHGAAYDYFVQFDIDHLPRPDYLERVLGYFSDPRVAWVQAPSLYGNLTASWVARGSAEQELVLQGPLQQGFFGHCETPFIIGSHCTYRTSAIAEIGGFQPTRAEDHLDTVMLAARGYRGVFVPEAIALGGGPETFETYLRQQFAWALSMMQVLVGFTPRLLRSYRPRQAVQFLFAQTWYPLWSTSMLVLFVMPLLALVTGREPSRAALWEFGIASTPLTLAAFVIWRWTRRWQMPPDIGLSWRGMVLHIARWPIVFWALLNALLRIRHPYMITPKGEHGGVPSFPIRTQVIYLLGALAGLGAVWQYLLRDEDANVDGYALFALMGAVYMLGVVATNVGSDMVGLRRRGLSLLRAIRLRAPALALVGLAFGSLVSTACAAQSTLLTSATWTAATAPSTNSTPGAEAAREVLVKAEPPMVAHDPLAAFALATSGVTPAPPKPRVNPKWLDQLDNPTGAPVLGAYDPWQDGADLALGIDHWYIRQDDPRLFADALDHATGRIPLITIEPFPKRSGTSVLERVTSGNADTELRALAVEVTERLPQVVLLRWGHEMDLTGLYPWSVSDPGQYQQAYRHVVEVFREAGATNARWVWSPAGEAGAMAFYPGDDVVDYVGLTVLSDAEWDFDMGYEAPRSLAEILAPRYAAVSATSKPVLLAEVGASGSPETQQAWLADGVNSLSAFQQVRGVVYFDDRNAPNNHRASEPDWRLGVDGLTALTELAQATAGPVERTPID